MRRTPALVAGIVSLLGCAEARLACPQRGGAPWLDLSTEHFLVHTDLSAEQARASIATLEQIHASLHQAAWQGTPAPRVRLEIVLLRSLGELNQFMPRAVEGVTWSDQGGKQLIIAQAGQASALYTVRGGDRILKVNRAVRPDVTLAHEIAHALNNSFFRRQPLWLAEGMAEYLETVTYDAGSRRSTIGEPPGMLMARFNRRDRRPKPGILLADRRVVRTTDEVRAFYADSWALVHWLLNRRPAEFNRFQQRLRQGEDPDAAWDAEIGARGADLDDAVAGYLDEILRNGGEYHLFSVEVPVWDGQVRSAPMSDGEVHALWARVLRASPAAVPAARIGAEVEEALRQDPLSPAVLEVALPELPADERLQRARAAVAAHPDDWRAHALLADALESLPDRAAALEQAIARGPQSFELLRALSRVRAAQGRGDEAVELAMRALSLGGVNPVSLIVLSTGLAVSGNCPEAVRVLRRALDFADHGASQQALQQLRERAALLEQGDCGTSDSMTSKN
jgi:tetratricopeptide (TPR) repeat protein